MATQPSYNSAGLIFALILLLSAGALLRLADSSAFNGASPPRETEYSSLRRHLNPYSAETEQSLNAHLRETSNRIEQERFHREIENQISLERNRPLQPQPRPEQEPLPLDSAESVGTGSRLQTNDPRWVSPAEIIQNELAHKQVEQKVLDQYRREYIRQYIQNAKAQGYTVEVDASGAIQRVQKTPPRKPMIPLDDPVANTSE